MTDETITLTRPGSGGSVATDPVLLPRRVGSVRLLRELGQGGMGAVWLGHDELLGRDVAVKFLAGAIAAPDDPGFATFLEGARAAAAVQHGCLNTIHLAGLVEASAGLSVPYLVMQYVDGPTLAAVIKRCERLSGNEALVVLGAICQGVGQLHDRGIVHRDIKPSNILLDGQGRVIVTDFGLSHRRCAAGAGGVAGTPIYMAPEMFHGEVSLRSDVYALGITAYELLAGAPPFKGTLEEISAQHATTPLSFEPLRQAGVQEVLFEVLERATHKNAVFRHKTARQFWRAVATAASFKEDSAKGAAVVAQLVAGSFYDTVGAIAQAKRAARTAAEPWRLEITEPIIDAGPLDPPITDAAIAPATIPPPLPPPLAPPNVDLPIPPATERASVDRHATHSLHCLNCGYDRFGLAPEAACPECGTIDISDQQRRVCAQLTQRPRRLLWRFFRLGKLPTGWWEVFNTNDAGGFSSRRAWLTVLVAVLISVLIAGAFQTILNGLTVEYTGSAYLYRDGDPQKRKVQEYGSGMQSFSPFDRAGYARRDQLFPTHPAPGLRSEVTWTRVVHFRFGRLIEYLFFLPMMGLLIGSSWVMYRYGWLNFMLRRRHDLSTDTGVAMRRAANALAMLHVAQTIWFCLAILLIFPIASLFTTMQGAQNWVWNTWLVLALGYPLVVWWAALRADHGDRLFPRRRRVTLLLPAAVQFLFFLVIGVLGARVAGH